MSGRRKIILHIGLSKTGTSTIQNVLHANRDLLLAHDGVLYPSPGPNHSTPLVTIFKDNPQRRTFNWMAGVTTEEKAARRQSYLDSLDTELSSLEWNTLVLSAEGVSNLTTPETAELREWGEKYSSNWLVLVCVRHPVDWTRSMMQQRLKRGDTLHQLYEDLPMPNYRANISKAISVFGRENVRVFDLEGAAQSEGGLVGTFARLAGLSAQSGDLLASRAVRANESLSLEGTWILDSLNRQRPMFLEDDARAPRRAWRGHELAYLRRIEGRKFDVPDSVKEEVRLGSREDVAWLNETFGLDLYRDVAQVEKGLAPPAHSHEVAEEPAIDSIAGIVGDLVAQASFHRFVERGKEAMSRGNLERAQKMLGEAARLDPDARQPKNLLQQLTAQQRGRFVDGQQGSSSYN